MEMGRFHHFSVDLTEKGTFEQILEGPGRKHYRQRKWAIQGLGEQTSVYWRNSTEASVAGAE